MGRSVKLSTRPLGNGQRISSRSILVRAPMPRTSRGSWEERRSEEHTSELQSPDHLVCRLLLEKKKKKLEYEGVYRIDLAPARGERLGYEAGVRFQGPRGSAGSRRQPC